MLRSWKETSPALAAILVLVAAGAAIWEAVGGALQVGVDEHYELSKAMLWAKGFPLYRQVWSDQPALYTVVLGLCFKAFGFTIAVARGVAGAFGLWLLAGVHILVKRQCGRMGGWVAAFCLLAAPGVLDLIVSPMLEVPAIATALWAFLPLLRWQENGRWCWLSLSGGLVATALHLKMTALVAVPALVREIHAAARRKGAPGRPPKSWGTLATWVASAAVVYVGLAAVVGTVPWDVFWLSHFSPGVLRHDGGSPGPPLWTLLWCYHNEALWAASVGLLTVLWRRQWHRASFPLTWLLTAVLIHAWHRPWWPYYYLHLAVPLAWLCGHGAAELWHATRAMGGVGTLRAHWLAVCGTVAAASLVLAQVTVCGGIRLASELGRIRAMPQQDNANIVETMRQYAHRTTWVYARQTIYVFHAGLAVVPEVAVLPRKRFWSGQITEAEIWATIRRYQPEQLLLEAGDWVPDAREFVEARYRLVHAEGGLELYVAKRLADQ